MAKKFVTTVGLPLSLIFVLMLTGCSGGVSTAANNPNNNPLAPTVTLTVTPATISAGQSAILAWASLNATSVVIDQGIGTEPTNGSLNISPNSTVTYHATAQAADGKATAAATLTVSANPSGPAPLVEHVFIVMEENHGYADVIGNASMPYLNQLAASGGLATHYFANTHPSIGNYFELTTGQIVSNDDEGFNQTVTADNIVRELLTAGKTWKSYAENLPAPGYLGGDVYPYLRHHNPFTFFSDVANSSTQRANLVPFAQFSKDLASNQQPNFSFIIPNALDDAHDGSLQQADNWLKTNLAPIIASPVFQREGLLIILFDESEVTDIAFGGGHVAMVMVGPHVKAGFQSTNFYQHQSTLRMMLESLGAKQFPGGSASAPEMSEFFK